MAQGWVGEQMRYFRPVIVTAAASTATALAFLAAAYTRRQVDEDCLLLAVTAVPFAVVAANCWSAWRRERQVDARLAAVAAEYRHREEFLIRSFARLGGNPTGPMQLRAVAGEAYPPARRP